MRNELIFNYYSVCLAYISSVKRIWFWAFLFCIRGGGHNVALWHGFGVNLGADLGRVLSVLRRAWVNFNRGGVGSVKGFKRDYNNHA